MGLETTTNPDQVAVRLLRLAIDVGNTRTKLGLFEKSADAAVQWLPNCVRHAVVLADQPLPWDELQSWKSANDVWLPPVMAGSNPVGVEKLKSTWPSSLGELPRHITNSERFPLAIDVGEPRRVGIDRLLNAVAVNAIRDLDRQAIVVDSGTATTVDVVSRDGAFAGGAILPGLALSAKALHEYTALLPLVSAAEFGQEIPDAIGRHTRAAILSGLFWGQLGAVKELIARQCPTAALFVTGGGGALLAKFLPHARFEPHLALQGLTLIADRRPE